MGGGGRGSEEGREEGGRKCRIIGARGERGR